MLNFPKKRALVLFVYVMANVESRLELSQLNSSPQVWG